MAPAHRMLAFTALATLLAVRLSLWMLSFDRVMRFVTTSGFPRSIYRGCTPPEVAGAVQSASRLAGATCLSQALTTQKLLSWCGHPSRLHIGVSLAEEFEAHAWVECCGRVVMGSADGLDRFIPILTMDTQRS